MKGSERSRFNKDIDRRAAGVAVLAVLAVYVAAVAITRSAAFAREPALLAAGVALDLTVTATLLAYGLGVRRARLPRWVLVPVFAGGLLAAHALLPDEHRGVASALASAWFVAEIAAAAWVLMKLRAVAGVYRARRRDGEPLIDALEAGLAAALGNGAVTRLLAAEIALLVFATAGLFRRPPAGREGERDERTWNAVLFGLGVAMTGEAVAVHLLLSSWSTAAAVVGAALHLYATLWLVGDYRALRLSRGIAVERGERLRIDLGLHARAVIPLASIDRVERAAEDAAGDDPPGAIRATLLGKPNVWIYLDEPVTVRLSFGRVRAARVIGIAAADPDSLGLPA